jgi:dTDP-4-dehydrorhamnose 3,5-epimerase-like enzyme
MDKYIPKRIFKDIRGKSLFDIFSSIKGQVDITFNYKDTVRAFHLHQKKDEFFFVVSGEFKFVLTKWSYKWTIHF